MSNNYDFDRAVDRLKRPFAFRDLEWVPNYSYGKSYPKAVISVAPYVRRESIITRFNIVCGKDNWKNELLPLGNAGLYQAILLRYKDEWIPNWDGAAISQSGAIDGIKGVSSKSLRRAAEMWDVGLYTQFVPELFAVKRPEKDWDSYDKYSKKAWDFTVRWDRPELPKEFLPKYMTPEQYRRMARLIKYLDEDSEDKFQKIIDSWLDDCDSVKYEAAEKLIDRVQSSIEERLNSINPTVVSQRKPKDKSHGKNTGAPADKKTQSSKNKGKSGGQQSGKGQGKGQQSKGQQKNNASPQQGKGISKGEVQQLVSNIKKFDDEDPNGVFIDLDWMEEIKQNVNKHSSGKVNYYISKEQFDDWMQQFAAAMDDMDDLPF